MIRRHSILIASEDVIIIELWMVVLVAVIVMPMVVHKHIVSGIELFVLEELCLRPPKVEISFKFLVIFIPIVLVHPI